MNKKYAIWFILGAYGIYFAILSGVEEVLNGKYWKLIFAFILGLLSYFIMGRKSRN
jgi:hypothetical protein